MRAWLIAAALVLGPVQAYNQGNALYARKDYPGAAAAYEQALRSGHDARVHYNLGNALFKSGKIGEAILNYRRAYYLAPRDADVAANLAYARAYRVDKLPQAASPLARAAARVCHLLSRREAALLAALMFTLAGFALAAWIVWRVAPFAFVAGVLAVAGLFGFASERVWAGEVNGRPAVVVVPEASAASGPGDEFKQVLLIHDGAEVELRESRGAYDLVQLPGGSGGWLPRSEIERVY